MKFMTEYDFAEASGKVRKKSLDLLNIFFPLFVSHFYE